MYIFRKIIKWIPVCPLQRSVLKKQIAEKTVYISKKNSEMKMENEMKSKTDDKKC